MSNLQDVKVPVEELARNRQERIYKWQKEKRRQKTKMTLLSTVLAAAALFFIAITTSLISPTVSNYVSALPGMGWLKEEMKRDTTLQSLVENDHFIPLTSSTSDDKITITLNGLIADETDIRVYFEAKMSSKEPFPNYKISLYENDHEIEASVSMPFDFDGDGVISDFTELGLEDGVFESNKRYELQFALNTGEVYRLPFVINKPIAKSKIMTMNETITLQNQRLHVVNVEITPLKSIITFRADPTNTMQILQLESVQIIDAAGNQYSKFSNGLVSKNDATNDTFRYYIESSYFNESEPFYLKIDGIQAIEKDEAYITITEKKEVILPKSLTKWQASIVNDEFVLTEILSTNMNTASIGSYFDVTGKELYPTTLSYGSNDHVKTLTIPLPSEDEAVYPLKLEILGYPNYLNDEPVVLEMTK